MTKVFGSQLRHHLIELWLIGCCVGFHRCLPGAEQRLSSTASPEDLGAPATREQAFSDPFAAEKAPTQQRVKISDPLEPINRRFFWFNDKLYLWVLRPGARAYTKVIPRPIRSSVRRFFANAQYPVRLVNNVLQGRLKPAGIETARFLLNSTIGVAGLLDPADKMKVKAQPADFDQTLAVYGLRPGFYVDWPILGPSSLRGSVGLGGDALLTPWTYLGLEISLPVRSCEVVNTTSLHPGEYEDFKKAALDPYVALRSAYYESRQDLIWASRFERVTRRLPEKRFPLKPSSFWARDYPSQGR